MNRLQPGPDDQTIEKVLDRLHGWAAERNFHGFNKHDGLNSPLLHLLLGWAKWPRIVAIQSVMRAPFNIRPLLLTPRTINPKGLALFSLGLLDRYHVSGNPAHLDAAETLLRMLREGRSNHGKWSGDCWGYPYPWQDLGFFAPTNTPNAVVTTFVCEAFLQAYRVTRKAEYLETVRRASLFFLRDLTVIEDSADFFCLGYMPLPMTTKVMDVSILVGAVLAQYGSLASERGCFETARRLVHFVVDKQTDYGAWYYTDPPGDSPIGHDSQ